MSKASAGRSRQRAPLTRERILHGAVELADRAGVEELTMRNVADLFGFEAMSLYYHVDNKSGLLDGAIEIVVGEILDAVAALESPPPEDDWKAALRQRILAARGVLLRHPWAPAVIEQRTSMTPAVVTYFEGVLEILVRGGFSFDLAHHALHALGSRSLGFSQELFSPSDAASGEASAELVEEMAAKLPYLFGMMAAISHDDPDSTIGWCDDQAEFEFGIDVLLEGLDRRRPRPEP
jgi:AcrR family transcriptional regulator